MAPAHAYNESMDDWSNPQSIMSFLDRIPLRFFAKDRHGVYLYANDSFAADYGLSADQVPGKTDFDLFPDVTARSILEEDETVMTRGIDLDLVEEARYVGNRSVVRLIKRPMGNPRDGVSGVMGIYWEITKETKNREALEDSKRWLRMILEASGIGISHYDVEQKRFYWDKQCSRIFGVFGKNEDDFSGFLNRIVPEDRESIIEAFERFLEGKRSYKQEFRMIWPDGTLRYVLAHGEWTADADHGVPSPTYINMDITDRRRTEEALKSQLELNRSVADSSLDEILHMGVDESVRLTSSRIGFFHLVDEDAGTISPKIWSRETKGMCGVQDLPAQYLLEKAGIWADCVRERRPVIHNDYAAVPGRRGLPDGHVPLVRELVVPLFEGDRITAVLGVGNKPRNYTDFDADRLSLIGENILNVAAKKRADQELEQAHEKAVADNKVKDRFFSILAHDLTNPVSNIRILAEQISVLAESEEPDRETLREIARILGNSVGNAQRLLADLLTWSRSQRNAIEFSPEGIEAAEPAEKAVASCAAVAAGKGIEIEKDFAEGAPAFADANMMRTVLRNLLMNAVKFTPRGGKVMMGVRSEGGRTIYTVRDNGIGIPEERLVKLFSLEGTLSTKGTESEKGTGLGLILCKEFVGKHNGEITAESTVGKGTTITVSIPGEPGTN